MALEPGVRLVEHAVVARPHPRRVLELGSVHDDLGAGTLERARHADVIGMKVGYEHSSHVFDRDVGVSERGPERGLGFLRMHSCVDEGVAGRALDEVRVDASQSEGERKRDAPDARRDHRRVQRDESFAKRIALRMVISRPVRLVA